MEPPAVSRWGAAMPDLLAEIADVAGLDAAMAVAAVKGGTRAHFPAKCADDHWLTRAVGRAAADKLCDHFRVNHVGGVSLQVPLGPMRHYAVAKRRAMELRKTHSIAETARILNVSSRAVEKWTAGHRDTRQGDLF